MNNLKQTKRLAQRKHFRARAKERLGFELCEGEIAELKKNVEQGFAILVATPNLRSSVYRVNIASRSLIVVYDNETEELVTLLTNGIWQEQTMSNTPYVKDEAALKVTLADTPAGKVLQGLKEKL